MRRKTLLIGILIFASGSIYGFGTAKFQIPPYNLISKASKTLKSYFNSIISKIGSTEIVHCKNYTFSVVNNKVIFV